MAKKDVGVMQAIETFTGEVGGVPVVYGRGTRLRADHEAVKKFPGLFAPDADPEAIETKRRALYAEAMQSAAESARQGQSAAHIPRPIPPEHRLTATRNELIPLSGGGVMTVSAGDVVDGRDGFIRSVKKARRGLFVKAI